MVTGDQGKTIVVCCDGTWNDAKSHTNVRLTYELLKQRLIAPTVESNAQDCTEVSLGSDQEGRAFALFYDCGVGTQRGTRGSGGAVGKGLGDNVRQAYAFLTLHWNPGDRIFCLGFSRGAFTARSLCGMLGAAGLVDPGEAQACDAAWAYYRTDPEERCGDDGKAAKARLDRIQKSGAQNGVPVRFLGVWDTVGSLGVPIPPLRGLSDRFFGELYRFHDTALGRNVINAFQALAIHEQRGAFKPVLWTSSAGLVKDEKGKDVPQRVVQTWFTGVHGDVGGGYNGDCGLADLSFAWMLSRARDSGLPLGPSEVTERMPKIERVGGSAWAPNPLAARHDSLTLTWRLVSGQSPGILSALIDGIPFVGKLVMAVYATLAVRNVERAIGGEIPTDDGPYVVGLGERVHESVLERFRGEYVPAGVKAALSAEMPVFREIREDRRPPLDGEASVIVDGREARIIDLSAHGLQVEMESSLRPGQLCRLNGARGEQTAMVVWCRGTRAGLHIQANVETIHPSQKAA